MSKLTDACGTCRALRAAEAEVVSERVRAEEAEQQLAQLNAHIATLETQVWPPAKRASSGAWQVALAQCKAVCCMLLEPASLSH